jgi:hypothetical protein
MLADWCEAACHEKTRLNFNDLMIAKSPMAEEVKNAPFVTSTETIHGD